MKTEAKKIEAAEAAAEETNPFKEWPGREEERKAFWAAHWASNPSSGELYEGNL